MTELRVNHHFVPESYLKRWKNSDNKVWTYKLLVNHSSVPEWRLYSPSAIAYQKHLYTKIVSGYESDEVEIWLDKAFEFPANAIIEKVIAEKSLSKNDWRILIRFLAAQDARTPTRLIEHMQWMKKEFPEILQSVMDRLEEKLIANTTSSEIAKSEKTEEFPLKLIKRPIDGIKVGMQVESYSGRSTWIYAINHLLKKTINVLFNHSWTIVKPAKGFYWFTSDNPVVKLNYYDKNSYDLRGGWGMLNGNIIFP